MKSKLNLIGLLLTVLLLTCGMALGFSAPYPIGGEILAGDSPVVNAEVEIINLDTNAKVVVTTNANGWYQADLPNFDDRYRQGDKIRVMLQYCKALPECSVSTIVEGGGSKVSFDITEFEVPLPEDVIVIKHTCWDGSIVFSRTDCPIQIIPDPDTIIKEQIVCEDGSVVEKAEDCPEQKSPINLILLVLSGILAVVSLVLAKFKWGKGFVGLVTYYKKKGDEARKNGDTDLALKHYARAAKMAGTAIDKAKDGKY